MLVCEPDDGVAWGRARVCPFPRDRVAACGVVVSAPRSLPLAPLGAGDGGAVGQRVRSGLQESSAGLQAARPSYARRWGGRVGLGGSVDQEGGALLGPLGPAVGGERIRGRAGRLAVASAVLVHPRVDSGALRRREWTMLQIHCDH